MTLLTGAEVFRNYVVDGVPGSGPNPVSKSDATALFTRYESLLNGSAAGLAYATLALLNADLAHAANVLAIVYGDATPANNGLYVKAGTSGAGSWSRIGDLPNGIIRLTVTGGTGDAIIATAPETPTVPGAKLYLLTPTANNTTATTIAVNGGSPVSIKNAFGVDLAAGSLINGSQVLMASAVGNYQLLISAVVDGTAILATVVADMNAAATSATAAAASASALGNQVHQYDTHALAVAATIPSGINGLHIFGYYAIGDGGASSYVKVGSAPSHPGKLQSADGAWWEIKENALNPMMFGAKRDTAGFDSWQAFSDCIATIDAQAGSDSVRHGGQLRLPNGQYETSKPIVSNTPGMRVIGDGELTSVIKAQAGFVGGYVFTHTPSGTAGMAGVGLIGVGIDCNNVANTSGYLGETVYDNIIYDGVRISNLVADQVGFTLQLKSGSALTVCQTIDIRSLFIDKTLVKGTVPAVLIKNCNEITISGSKAWNGYGSTVATWGVAPWFIQDCRAITLIDCSTASATQGFHIYGNTVGCAQVSIINPTIEQISGTILINDCSNPATMQTTDLSVVNPRYQGTIVGGYSLDEVIRGYLEVLNSSVSLSANVSLVTVVADQLSQILDSGTRNMLHSRVNLVEPYESFGNDIVVKPGGNVLLQTELPASGQTSLTIGVFPSGGSFSSKLVLVGAADSGGTGFRALTILN